MHTPLGFNSSLTAGSVRARARVQHRACVITALLLDLLMFCSTRCVRGSSIVFVLFGCFNFQLLVLHSLFGMLKTLLFAPEGKPLRTMRRTFAVYTHLELVLSANEGGGGGSMGAQG